MSASPAARPWGEPRPASSNKPPLATADLLETLKRRLLMALTVAFLAGGAALHLLNIRADSANIAHTSRSALIFGIVGLRGATQVQAETIRDGGDPRA